MNDVIASKPSASSLPNTLIPSTFTPSPKVTSSRTTAHVSSSTSKASTPTVPHSTLVTPKGIVQICYV